MTKRASIYSVLAVGLAAAICLHAAQCLGQGRLVVGQLKLAEPQKVENPAEQADGEFVKIVNVATGKVLGVEDDSTEEQAAIVITNDGADSARQWKISAEGESIKITNRNSGKVLDLQQASKAEGASIIQWRDKSPLNAAALAASPGGLDNQLWVWEGNGAERRLKSKWSDMVLDVDDSDNHIVQRSADPQSRKQLWRVVKVTKQPEPRDGMYLKIVHVQTGKVLGILNDNCDVQENDTALEGQAILAKDERNTARQWKLEKDDGDCFKLANRKSGQVLDVRQGLQEEGSEIIQWIEWKPASDNQRWIWEGEGRERRVRSKKSGLVLDVDPQGHIIQKKSDASAKSQLWRIVESDPIPFTRVGSGSLPVNVTDPVIQLAGGDYATGRLVDCDTAGTLRWQSPAATKPFEFVLSTVEAVYLPPSGNAPAGGEYCVELANGDVLFGSLVAISADKITLDSPTLGKIEIGRERICRLFRQGTDAGLVYFGPNGTGGWTTPGGAKDWHEDAGDLVATGHGATTFAKVNLPAQACIEFQVAWKKADFVIAVGVDSTRDQALRNCFRLEAADNKLVLIRELDKVADIAEVQCSPFVSKEVQHTLPGAVRGLVLGENVSSGPGTLHLRLYLDQPQGRMIVCSANDHPLVEMKLRDPRIQLSPGVYAISSGIALVNRGGDLRLNRLKVARWNGTLPSESQVEASQITKNDGSVVSGEIVSFNATDKEITVAGTSEKIRLKPEEIAAIEMKRTTGQPGANVPADEELPLALRVVMQDGTRITGKLAGIEKGRLRISRPGVEPALHFPVVDLQSMLVMNNNPGEQDTQPTASRPGVLETEGLRLNGSLVETAEDSKSALVWRSMYSRTDAPLVAGLSGRIIYRETAPPANPQPQTTTLRGVRVVAPIGAAPAAVAVVRAANTETAPFKPAFQTKPNGPQLIYLRTGDIIPCTIKRIDEEGIQFESTATKATQIPHSRVKVVEMIPAFRGRTLDHTRLDRLLTLPRLQKNNPPTHLVLSTSGDYLRGRLVGLDAETLTLEVQLETKRLPRDRIAKIIWFEEDSRKEDGKTAEPDQATLVQAVRQDGIRLTFVPERTTATSLAGTSDILGPCQAELASVDQLLIGTAVMAAEHPYRDWKLHNAVEPRYVNEDANAPNRSAAMQSTMIGKPAPNFELPLLGGGQFRLAGEKGKVVILDFFATWCGPCVNAMPQVDAVAAEFKDQGVKLVAVNMQEDAKAIRSLLERLNLEPAVAMDRDGAAAEKYGVTAIPQTVIIDTEGNVARLFIGGGPNFGDQLRDALKEVLNPAAAKPPN